MAIEPSSYYKDWNQVFPEETGRSLLKHLREVSEPDNVFPVWSFTICTETMGAFYSTKSFESLEAAENGRKFPGEVLEIPENVEFRSEMRTIQPKIVEIPGAELHEKKTSGRKFRKFR